MTYYYVLTLVHRERSNLTPETERGHKVEHQGQISRWEDGGVYLRDACCTREAARTRPHTAVSYMTAVAGVGGRPSHYANSVPRAPPKISYKLPVKFARTAHKACKGCAGRERISGLQRAYPLVFVGGGGGDPRPLVRNREGKHSRALTCLKTVYYVTVIIFRSTGRDTCRLFLLFKG